MAGACATKMGNCANTTSVRSGGPEAPMLGRLRRIKIDRGSGRTAYIINLTGGGLPGGERKGTSVPRLDTRNAVMRRDAVY